jgi:predicted dehydrogenase
MLGVGIIGAGAVARIHARAFSEVPGTFVAAIADKNPARAEAMAREFGVPACPSVQALLERADVQVVSICTPSGNHEEPALCAARAGRHVIVEKPLEITLARIDRIIEECERHGVRLATVLNNRYREGNLFLKRAIDAGRFGRLLNANVQVRWYRTREYYAQSSWRGTWALDGGGALMNQAIHYVDLLLWFIGDIDSVAAYAGTLLHRQIETEDTAVAIFRSRSAVIGTIVAGTCMYPGFPARIEISGERGSAAICDGVIDTWALADSDPLDAEAKAFMSGRIDNARASEPMAFDHTYHRKQFEQVVEAIRGDVPVEVSGREGRKSVELIQAIYQSAEESREVRLGAAAGPAPPRARPVAGPALV